VGVVNGTVNSAACQVRGSPISNNGVGVFQLVSLAYVYILFDK